MSYGNHNIHNGPAWFVGKLKSGQLGTLIEEVTRFRTARSVRLRRMVYD